MGSAKLPTQADLDSEILHLDNPFSLALHMGCIATALIAVMSWLALFGLMTTGLTEWRLWPFVAAPIVVWIIALAWPALLITRRGALSTLDALATTAEAWLARAGYSIDLNNDGYIGRVKTAQIEPVQTEVITPAVWSGPGGVRLLTNEAAAIPELAAAAPGGNTMLPLGDPARPQRRLWELPGGVKCPEATVKDFVERIFIIGWGRGEWVGPGKPLERDVYDGLMNLLSQTQIIEGRKAGHAGKLTVDDPASALRVLGLG